MREVKGKNYWALFSFLMIIIIIAIGYFLISPYISELKDLNTKVLARTKENQELQEKITALRKLKQEFEENSDTINLLDLALPEKDMLAEVIETIGDIAEDSVTEITSIKQTKSKDKDMTQIDVSFESSYPSFKMFLEDLENNIRLVTPVKVNLSQTKNTEEGESFLKGNLSLDFFKVESKAESDEDTQKSTESETETEKGE